MPLIDAIYGLEIVMNNLYSVIPISITLIDTVSLILNQPNVLKSNL